MKSETNIPTGLREAAAAFVSSDVQPLVADHEVLVGSLSEYADCWLVGYQTRAALEGDWTKMLAGNQPFQVVFVKTERSALSSSSLARQLGNQSVRSSSMRRGMSTKSFTAAMVT